MASKWINCILIAKPDDSLKCNLCLDVASHPKQCMDCGKMFCSECIKKYGRKPCLYCRKENPRYFKDVKSKSFRNVILMYRKS